MKKVFSIVICGLFLGAVTAMISSLAKRSQTSSQRWPSSASQIQWQGKHQRLLEISIDAVGGIPDSDEKDLVLRARIQGLQPLAGEVFYQWILPPEASLVAGELSDSVMGLPDPEKYLEPEVTVHGVSHEDGQAKIVVLQVYTVIDGVKIGNSAVFSTAPQSATSVGQSQEKSASKVTTGLPAHIQQ